MNTQIAKTQHVTDYDGDRFFQNQLNAVNEMQELGLIPEVHYQMAMQPNGKALYSVMIFGRVKE